MSTALYKWGIWAAIELFAVTGYLKISGISIIIIITLIIITVINKIMIIIIKILIITYYPL
jgi:hypothetical protein